MRDPLYRAETLRSDRSGSTDGRGIRRLDLGASRSKNSLMEERRGGDEDENITTSQEGKRKALMSAVGSDSSNSSGTPGDRRARCCTDRLFFGFFGLCLPLTSKECHTLNFDLRAGLY